jgi:hypothetical protein
MFQDLFPGLFEGAGDITRTLDFLTSFGTKLSSFSPTDK